MRVVLEAYIVEQVCKSGLEEGVRLTLERRWRQLYEALPEMTADPVKEDEAFHEALASAVGNRAMIDVLEDIRDKIRFVRAFDITDAARLKATCMQHLEILEAIGRRDVDTAVEILRRNIEGGRNQVESAVKDALANAYEIYR